MKKCLRYGICSRTKTICRCISRRDCGCMTYCGQKLRSRMDSTHGYNDIFTSAPLSNEKAFVCYPFSVSATFLGRFPPFVAHVELLLTQYRVTFICERPRRRSLAVVGPLQSGRQSRIGGNE